MTQPILLELWNWVVLIPNEDTSVTSPYLCFSHRLHWAGHWKVHCHHLPLGSRRGNSKWAVPLGQGKFLTSEAVVSSATTLSTWKRGVWILKSLSWKRTPESTTVDKVSSSCMSRKGHKGAAVPPHLSSPSRQVLKVQIGRETFSQQGCTFSCLNTCPPMGFLPTFHLLVEL